MKSTFSAGRFSVEISEPHPVFVTLRMDERGLVGIHHSELADLLHVVQRAVQAARVVLKPSGRQDEV